MAETTRSKIIYFTIETRDNTKYRGRILFGGLARDPKRGACMEMTTEWETRHPVTGEPQWIGGEYRDGNIVFPPNYVPHSVLNALVGGPVAPSGSQDFELGVIQTVLAKFEGTDVELV